RPRDLPGRPAAGAARRPHPGLGRARRGDGDHAAAPGPRPVRHRGDRGQARLPARLRPGRAAVTGPRTAPPYPRLALAGAPAAAARYGTGRASGTLVLVAHGTRDPAGEAVLAALAARVRAERPGHRVELAFLEISSPLLADLPARLPEPVVVVPLLLAAGYHVRVDLPGVLARTRPDAVVARPLGPHPLLASALARRLAAAGLRTADAVVL